MTNAEKIRQMADEELVKFLREIEQSPDGPWQGTFIDHVCSDCGVQHLRVCDRCPEGDEILWWLDQEVSENDENGY